MSISHLLEDKEKPWAKIRLQDITIDGSNPSLKFNGTLPESTSLSHVLGIDSSTKHLARRPVSSIMVNTIYSADGTLAGDRIVDADNNSLGVSNCSDFELETDALYLTNAPQAGNTNGQLLSRNSASGRVEERQVSGLKSYDAIVDASGNADYTSISAALVDSHKYIFVRDGSYDEGTGAVYLPDNCVMIGESRDGVNVSFTGFGGFFISGGTVYSTGTVTLTNASATLTGLGTLWTANLSGGEHIMIDNMIYTVESVNSDTDITLTSSYRGVTRSSLAYQAFTSRSTRIENMTIVSELDCINCSSCVGIVLKNLILSRQSGSIGDGVVLNTCGLVTIQGCYINARETGIRISNDVSSLVISGNEIISCSQAGIGFGLGDKRGIRISDNNVSACQVGIDIDFDGEEVYDIVIDSNVISNNNEEGLNGRRNLAGAGERIIVSNNQVTNNGSRGIAFQGDFIDSSIIGNSVNYNGERGIFLWNSLGDCKNITISGNTTIGNVDDGIAIGSSNHSEIAVNANISSSNGGHGITVDEIQNASITGNVCFSNTENGINIEGNNGNRFSVTSNTCDGNDIGLYFTQADRIVCVGNVATNSASHGIEFDSNIVNAICGSCIVNDNGGDGILISASNSQLICTSNNCLSNTGTNLNDLGASTTLANNVTV